MDRKGVTSLYSASVLGHMKTVKILVNAGANIDAQNISGITALMASIAYEMTRVSDYLFKQGADINGWVASVARPRGSIRRRSYGARLGSGFDGRRCGRSSSGLSAGSALVSSRPCSSVDS